MAELFTVLALIAYPKSYCGEIGYKLRHEEIRCHCSRNTCDHTLVSEVLLERWATLRRQWNKPLYLTSVFRCDQHNQAVGGVPDSNHKKGLAMDVDTSQMSHAEYVTFNELADEVFDFCQAHETFTHCQVNR